jgi:Ser/Thr protein kinase RdoA (MazF antagonist)
VIHVAITQVTQKQNSKIKRGKIMKKLIIKALSDFGLNEIESISRIKNKNNNIWVIDNKYIVKTHDDLKNLEKILFINIELYKAGALVPKYYKTNIDKYYVKVDDEIWFTLADKMPGSTFEYYTGNYQKRAFSIGKNIAEFHLALKELTGKIDCWDNNFMNEYHGWISHEIKDKNIRIKQEILNYLDSFDELYRKLPRQIIHRDLHRGNMLINNDEVTAFIDINDITQVNVKIFDLCYYLSFFPDKEEEQKWFEVFQNLFSGYNAVFEFSNAELEAIPYMFVFVELLWIAFEAMVNGSSDYSPDNGFWSYDNKNKLRIKQARVCKNEQKQLTPLKFAAKNGIM